MAYDRPRLADAARRRLLEKPATSLKQLAELEGVERHTITMALEEAYGLSFRQLQNACIVQASTGLFQNGHGLSMNIAALRLGFSGSRTFARRYRALTGQAPTAARRCVERVP